MQASPSTPMKILALLLIGIKRVEKAKNGNLILEINPDVINELTYHVISIACLVILALNENLMKELIKAFGVAYILASYGQED